MLAPSHDRDTLLQRLPAEQAALCTPQGHDLIIWQDITLHCGPLPLGASYPGGHIELCLLWQPLPHTPAALLVAGEPTEYQQCQTLLQMLAGSGQPWLYCGPLGAAGLCKRVFDSLFYLAGPALAQHASQMQGAAVQIDWLGLVRQQQQLADKLAALCRHYLAQHGIDQLPQDVDSVLDGFRQPPQQQTHYALTLATLLALALELGQPARKLFDSLLPTAHT